MPKLWSKLFRPFRTPCFHRVSLSGYRTPTFSIVIDEDGYGRSLSQAATVEVKEGIEPKEGLEDTWEKVDIPRSPVTPSAREHGQTEAEEPQLTRFEAFRIRLEEVRLTLPHPDEGGDQGEVVQATFSRADENQLVAVKRFESHPDLAKSRISSFIHEVEVTSGLSHGNIVRFVGFVEEGESASGQSWIMTSWEPNGKLLDFLETNRCGLFNRISFMRDIFEGLNYLHTRQPPVCHGNLKPLNILVTSSCHAVISDFSSARFADLPIEGVPPGSSQNVTSKDNQEHVHESITGTVLSQIAVSVVGDELVLTGPVKLLQLSPPEVVEGGPYGLAGDVWRAGWVCWEVVTGKSPPAEPDVAEPPTQVLVKEKLLSNGEAGNLSCLTGLCRVMKGCWAAEPHDRRTALQCRDDLQSLQSEHLEPDHPPTCDLPPAQVLLEIGQAQAAENNHETAVSLIQLAWSIAISEEDPVSSAEASFRLGDLYRAQSKLPQAEETWAQSLELYAHVDDSQGLANTFLALGHIYRLQSKYHEAEESFVRAEELYVLNLDDLGQANALRGLGQIYQVRSMWDDAEETYRQAEESYARLGEGCEHDRANTLDWLGEVYRARSKYGEAEGCLTRAEEIFVRLGDERGQARMLAGLGEISRLRLKDLEAEAFFIRAKDMFSRAEDAAGRANVLAALGEMYRGQRKYDEAEQSYVEADEIYTRLGDNGYDRPRANVLDGLGAVYFAQLRYTQSEESYISAEAIYTQLGDDLGQGNALLGLASIYRLQSKYAQTESCYTRAQEAFSRVGNYRGQANTLILLGHAYLLQGKFPEAERSYTRAQDIYSRIGDDRGRANTRCGVGHVRRREGRFEEAACFFEEAKGIFESVGDKEAGGTAGHWLEVVQEQQKLQKESSSTSSRSSPALAGLSLSRSHSLRSATF